MDKKYIMYIKKIVRPKKIDLFKHIVLFENENGEIELAYPDFEEKQLDVISSNVVKIKDKNDVNFFEVLVPDEISGYDPIYKVEMYNKIGTNHLELNQYLVNDSECVNGFSTSLDDEVIIGKTKLKKLTK